MVQEGCRLVPEANLCELRGCGDRGSRHTTESGKSDRRGLFGGRALFIGPSGSILGVVLVPAACYVRVRRGSANMHVPPILASEALKFGFEWLRRKVFRSSADTKKENQLPETPVESTTASDRLMTGMVYRDGAYWGEDGSGPYCKVCLLKDHVRMPLDEGATRGVYACPVHQTSYWSREYRESRAKRINRPRFHTWSQYRRYLEAQSRRHAGQ